MSYALTLATYFFIDLLLVLGVNLQLGLLGLPNLSFIISLGAGAYAVALFSVGPATADSLQHYFFGVSTPFPVPLIMAALAGMLCAFLIGAVLLKNMRGHYLAIVTLVIVIVVWTIVEGETSFLGGSNGIYGIPQPFHSLTSSVNGYAAIFLLLVALVTAACFVLAQRFFHSPLGRTARAIRENEAAAKALGKNPYRVRLIAFVVGGGFAALSGAFLAEYITVWTPSPWSINEIFPAVAAMIVGGRGNNWGAAVGTLLIDIGISQGITYVPGISSNPSLSFAIQWILFGSLVVAFLWLRPIGLLPERKARWRSNSSKERRSLAPAPEMYEVTA